MRNPQVVVPLCDIPLGCCFFMAPWTVTVLLSPFYPRMRHVHCTDSAVRNVQTALHFTTLGVSHDLRQRTVICLCVGGPWHRPGGPSADFDKRAKQQRQNNRTNRWDSLTYTNNGPERGHSDCGRPSAPGPVPVCTPCPSVPFPIPSISRVKGVTDGLRPCTPQNIAWVLSQRVADEGMASSPKAAVQVIDACDCALFGLACDIAVELNARFEGLMVCCEFAKTGCVGASSHVQRHVGAWGGCKRDAQPMCTRGIKVRGWGHPRNCGVGMWTGMGGSAPQARGRMLQSGSSLRHIITKRRISSMTRQRPCW